MNIEGFDILLEVIDLLGSRNGNDEGILREQPGEAELTRRTSLALRDLGDGFSGTQVLGEVLQEPQDRCEQGIRKPWRCVAHLLRKSRVDSPEITFLKVCWLCVLSGKHAPT